MKPESIIIPVICALACTGIGIYYGVIGNYSFLVVFLIGAAASFVPLVNAVITARKDKKNKKRGDDKK